MELRGGVASNPTPHCAEAEARHVCSRPFAGVTAREGRAQRVCLLHCEVGPRSAVEREDSTAGWGIRRSRKKMAVGFVHASMALAWRGGLGRSGRGAPPMILRQQGHAPEQCAPTNDRPGFLLGFRALAFACQRHCAAGDGDEFRINTPAVPMPRVRQDQNPRAVASQPGPEAPSPTPHGGRC